MVDIQWKKRDKDGNGKLDRNEFKDMGLIWGTFSMKTNWKRLSLCSILMGPDS